jgi:hypothetical protein
MRDNYDFSESVPNPYLKKLSGRLTLQLDTEVQDYFETLAKETGIPSQRLIALYLQDCVRSQRKPSLEWTSS